MIELPLFKKIKMFIFIELFCVSLSARNTFSKWGGKLQNFPGIATLSRPPQLYLGQTKLVSKHLALLRFFPISNIFPIIDQCRFFLLLGQGLIFWWKCLKITLHYISSAKTKVFSLELYWKCLLYLFPWKNLISNKNALKNYSFNLANFKYNKAVYFTGYLLF